MTTDINNPKHRSQLAATKVLHALFSTAIATEFEREIQYTDLALHHLCLNLLQDRLVVLQR
jgi:hypothetical protein